jgi:serine/threonine protein phosphatase 1
MKYSPPRSYAIGDVHGMSDMLRTAFEAIREDSDGDPALVVTLGDYVSRGPDGRGTIDLIRDTMESRSLPLVALRGNHEEMLIASLDDEGAMADWTECGGRQTYRQYFLGVGETTVDRHALRDDASFLRTLPLHFADDRRYYVHAGLRPGGGPDVQKDRDFLHIRHDFLRSRYDFGRPVVHGHSVTANLHPEVRPNRIALDTGAYLHDGRLSVAVFDDTQDRPIHFLIVEHGQDGGSPSWTRRSAAEFAMDHDD